jgi:arginine decarboxylase
MNIHIATGVGSGLTELAAFDGALNIAGIANYNLIRLSSVIPPNTTIIDHIDEPVPSDKLPGSWGDRLYVVMAEMRVHTPNTEAWAGIGWVQDETTGKGLFVEHEGHSEKSVREDITDSLRALMATRNVDFGPIQMHVVGRMCHRDPVCSMVVAVYQASDWQNKPYTIKE